MAALIFPPLVIGDDVTSVLLGITLLGGMLGSILTIVNPVGFIINRIYERLHSKALPRLTDLSMFVKKVISKNYEAALKSPSVSYETNKLVGMLYFLAILGLTLYRVNFDSVYLEVFMLTSQHTQIITAIAIAGFGMVLASILYHVFGWRSVSHLSRIRSVTVLLMARDLANLSADGIRIVNAGFGNENSRIRLAYELIKKIKIETFTNIEEFKQAVASQSIFEELKIHWKKEQVMYSMLWDYYQSSVRIAARYNLTLSQSIWWFKSGTFFEYNQFDEPLTQLQSSIESRDWNNADLLLPRITNMIEAVLRTRK